MNKFLTHILSVSLVIAMVAPSVVKLVHTVYEHEEIVCLDDTLDHIHSVEADCDLQKFKLSPQSYPVTIDFNETVFPEIDKNSFNYYAFLTKYRTLPFELRGPPVPVVTS